MLRVTYKALALYNIVLTTSPVLYTSACVNPHTPLYKTLCGYPSENELSENEPSLTSGRIPNHLYCGSKPTNLLLESGTSLTCFLRALFSSLMIYPVHSLLEIFFFQNKVKNISNCIF